MHRGIGDPRELYLDQFCALVWFMLTRDKKPEEIEFQKAQLWIPPKGVEIDERSPWHPANQNKQLVRVKGSKPAAIRATMPTEP